MLLREKALRIAITQIGQTEHPAGTNTGPMVNVYLRSAGLNPGFPWCMAFVHWCYAQAGLELEHPNKASVGFFQEWAKQHGDIVSTPQRGDIVCYNFDSDNWPDHVGIVEEAGSGRINTVEGNTAIGNDANGGMVMRRSRAISRCVFARIPGEVPDEEDELTLKQVKALEAAAEKFVTTNVGPGKLTEAENIVFWALVRSRTDAANSVNPQLNAVKAALAKAQSDLTIARQKIAAAQRDLA